MILSIVLSSQIVLPFFTTFISDSSPIIARNAIAAALPDFNFGAAGDWGCGADASHTVDNIISKGTELTIGLGDYSYKSTADCWFSTISKIDNQTKIAIGNRDMDSPGKLDALMSHFQLERQFYSFNYQNVHFLVMSTETAYNKTSEQYEFVRDDLAAAASNPEIGWIVVSFHRPMYLSTPISTEHSSLPPFRNIFHELFDQYNVDLVLQAHFHAYERMFPLEHDSSDRSDPIVTDSSTSSYNDPQGQIYVTVGTGGQSLDTFRNKTSSTVTQFSEFGFLNIDIINHGSTMRASFYGNDGTIKDQFTIAKSPSSNNHPPTAMLTADPTTIDEGQISNLDASASSDPDGDSLTYAFRQTAGTIGTIIVKAQSPYKASFQAPSVSANETATVMMTVDDGKGGVKTATIDIAVQNKVSDTTGCNCVIFRLDDVSDYSYSTIKRTILDQFIAKNQDLSLAIVMNHFGNDPNVVNKVREGYNKGLFELAIHGWDHVKFSDYSMEQQKTWLESSNEKLQDMFGRNSYVFITPYGVYNTDTLDAMSQLDYKIISNEEGSDHLSRFVANSSDIKDQYGIYHLPHSAKFFEYSTNVGIKVPVDKVLSDIDAGVKKYGYAIIVMHPQDFGKVVDGKVTTEVDQTQIDDLNYLIDTEVVKGRTITTFSKVVGLEPPPFVDNIAPFMKLPADIGAVQTDTLTKVSLGTPTVKDNTDPSPVVTNNAPANGFPLGTTIVTWTVTDASGNTAKASQYVTIAQTADTTRPLVSITLPRNGTTITGPSSGVVVTIDGTASDGAGSGSSGVKIVEVRSGSTPYQPATPKASNDWSTWNSALTIYEEGSNTIVARATDYFGNKRWIYIPITVAFGDTPIDTQAPTIADTTPPLIAVPNDIGIVQTDTLTKVSLGTPTVKDDSDPSPTVTNDAPTDGFPLGTTIVTWTVTDASGNTATASQYVTIAKTADTTLPLVSITLPKNGTLVTGPSTGVVVTIVGKASDFGSGIKRVELRIGDLPFQIVAPKAPNDWSSWQKSVTIEGQGIVYLQAKAIDYFGNVRWSSKIPITIAFEASRDVSGTDNSLLTQFQPMIIIIPVVAIPSLATYMVWRQRVKKKRKDIIRD